MMLSQLIDDVPRDQDVAVRGITDDSRKVTRDDLFLAWPGLNHDGRVFIGEAAGRCAAVVCEEPAPRVTVDVPVIAIEGLREKIGDIASRFFGNPSSVLNVVAVTGTNGKTSVTHYIAEAAQLLNRQCGIVGTLGSGVPGSMASVGLTTPDAITMQSCLASLLEQGCSMVALEASSAGLDQGRLNGTSIDVAVFTNLTHEHLEYHGSFDHYLKSKLRLFAWPQLRAAVFNKDDPHGAEVAAVSSSIQSISYGLTRTADVYATSVEQHAAGSSFQMHTPWGQAGVRSPLLGRFNIGNLLAAASVLGVLGFDIQEIAGVLSDLGNVVGRMHTVSEPGQPLAVVDYAHTPDALAKALVAIREHCSGEVWCVFGCGGDRDTGKRPLMGSVASRLADHVVVTDDNPRGEDPASIANDIVAGAENSENTECLFPRERAIVHAIGSAQIDDVVLIAGKGHETYQEIGGRRQPYSDFDVVERCFGRRHADEG